MWWVVQDDDGVCSLWVGVDCIRSGGERSAYIELYVKIYLLAHLAWHWQLECHSTQCCVMTALASKYKKFIHVLKVSLISVSKNNDSQDNKKFLIRAQQHACLCESKHSQAMFTFIKIRAQHCCYIDVYTVISKSYPCRWRYHYGAAKSDNYTFTARKWHQRLINFKCDVLPYERIEWGIDQTNPYLNMFS